MAEQRTYRKFSAKQKAEIVLAGLRGDKSDATCAERKRVPQNSPPLGPGE